MSLPCRRAKTEDRPVDDTAGWSGPPSPADRSCCCLARPVVRVLLPPTLARAHPVELLLCGHHYRASQVALATVGASGIDAMGTVVYLVPAGGQLGLGPPADWALDAKTAALVRVGALAAIGSPEVCVEWSATRALAVGATEDEITGVLLAIAPVIGLGRITEAVPGVAAAFEYDIEAALDESDGP